MNFQNAFHREQLRHRVIVIGNSVVTAARSIKYMPSYCMRETKKDVLESSFLISPIMGNVSNGNFDLLIAFDPNDLVGERGGEQLRLDLPPNNFCHFLPFLRLGLSFFHF